jgi:hypothetical protein
VIVEPVSSSLALARGGRDTDKLSGAIPQVAGIDMPHHRRQQAPGDLRGNANMDSLVAAQGAGLVVVVRVDLRKIGYELDSARATGDSLCADIRLR